MRKCLKKKHEIVIEQLEKQDETLLLLLKQGHRKLIIKTIKDYLSTIE